MNIFISWSGERSKMLADALKKFLPDVIQTLDIWMSEQDIVVGSRWTDQLNRNLEGNNFGIICLTPENLSAPWILYEAGCLAKSVAEGMVVPYRLKLGSADLEYPLAQFQGVDADEDGTKRLIENLNSASDKPLEAQRLSRSFEHVWPDIKACIEGIPASTAGAGNRRSERQLLEELLKLTRDRFISLETRIGSLGATTLHGKIGKLNEGYNFVLREGQKRLIGERVKLEGRKGRVQSVHLNAKGLRLDVLFDDGRIKKDVDARMPEYDP